MKDFDFFSFCETVAHLWDGGAASEEHEALESVSEADDLALNTLTIGLSGSPGDWDGLEMTLGFKGSWAFTEGVALALKTVTISLTRDDLDLSVCGNFLLDGYKLTFALTLPEFHLEASLAPEAEGSTDGLAARGVLPSKIAEEAQLTDLSVMLAPAFDRAILHLEVENALSLGHDAFAIDLLEVEAIYDGGVCGRPTGWARLKGRSETIGILFDLHAAVGQEGWSFAGSVAMEKGKKLGDLISKIAGNEHKPPKFLADIEVSLLSLAYNSVTEDFTAGLSLHLAAEDATCGIVLSRVCGVFQVTGRLAIGGAEFDLAFVGGDRPAAVFEFRTRAGEALDIMRLPEVFGANSIPHPVSIEIGAATVIMMDTDKVLAKPEISLGLDRSALAGVPFVGALIPDTAHFGLSLKPLIVHDPKKWETEDWTTGVGLAAPDSGLPESVPKSWLSGRVDLDLGGDPVTLDVDFDLYGAEDEGPTGGDPAGESVPTDASFSWYDIGKSLGPLDIARVGFRAAKDEGDQRLQVDLRFDAALTLAGLSLSAEGLGVGFKVDDKAHVEFLGVTLDGFGIDYNAAPLSFGGAFLKQENDFLGSVMIGAPTFTLHADGGLSMIGNTPSIFLYGVLDYPIGGPAFFFVEGLAAGFGVNRHLTAPKLKEVRHFPLVRDAMSAETLKGASNPAAKLGELHHYVRPELGEYFFAAGLRFTSFKVIESFVLLILRTGAHTEIDLIGTATYETPPTVAGLPPLARIGMDLLGHFAPDEGVISLEAKLTDDSFIYSGLCKITGHFGFASWYKGPHAGDFVICVGGYHPKFRKPAHYPDIGPVSLTFEIQPGCSISGLAYFAMTPNAVMAGGALHARADVGGAKAWFDLAIDFLVYWEPYHYDAHAHVDIGVRYGPFQAELRADLHIWGPPFSGTAHVDWIVISVDVKFGPGARPSVMPLTWDRFRTSFLPADPVKATSIRVLGGLVETRQTPEGEVWVLDPHDAAIAIDSTVPISEILFNETLVSLDQIAFGIAPSDRAVACGRLEVTLHKEDTPGNEPQVEHSAVYTNFPGALWAQGLSAARTQTVVRGGAGLEIRAIRGKGENEDASTTFPVVRLSEVPDACVPVATVGMGCWTDVEELPGVLDGTNYERAEALAGLAARLGFGGHVAARRAKLLALRGFTEDDITVGTAYLRGLRAMPQVRTQRGENG